MIGIRDRVHEAHILWEKGRREGAFLLALIAFAATARRRYPKMKDGEGFEQFFRDSLSARVGVEYRGKSHQIEHIFYRWFRCHLVHEGGLPVDIQFMEENTPDAMSFRAGGAPEYVLKIGHGWFHYLARTVMMSQESSPLFTKGVEQSAGGNAASPRASA
jgi:hypothetical protein